MLFSNKTIYIERLESLINISFKEQWSPEEKIDWNLPIIIPKEIPEKIYIDMVSQLYYAEEATIYILGGLLQSVPDLQAKQYLCTQAIDESRHSKTYQKYLEKLGDIAPINENLKAIFSTDLNNQHGYLGTIIALNVIMEGEALNQQRKRTTSLPCPLFKKINESIVKDEARHAAFGKIYMREKLTQCDKETKQNIYHWIKKLWGLWVLANQGRYIINGAEILRTENTELNDRWVEQKKILSSIGLLN
jgi:ribonucleotide reductase beta subunit family protein with ferritin-like domain